MPVPTLCARGFPPLHNASRFNFLGFSGRKLGTPSRPPPTGRQRGNGPVFYRAL